MCVFMSSICICVHIKFIPQTKNLYSKDYQFLSFSSFKITPRKFCEPGSSGQMRMSSIWNGSSGAVKRGSGYISKVRSARICYTLDMEGRESKVKDVSKPWPEQLENERGPVCEGVSRTISGTPSGT